MKYAMWLLLLAPALVVMVSCNPGPQVEEEPPLLLEEPPLLLEEPGEDGTALSPPDGPLADNSRCYVCHLNYEEEEFALAHARAEIGCEDCHGESTPHCSDEDNITPPDIMFAKAKINPSCLACHAQDKLSEVHEPVVAGTAEEKYCTDCHGEHRLAHRTRQWDKNTGELLKDDGVRMIRF